MNLVESCVEDGVVNVCVENVVDMHACVWCRLVCVASVVRLRMRRKKEETKS